MKTANQPNLDTVAKFHRLLAKEGVEPEHINAPNNSVAKRRNLAEFLKAGCPKINKNSEVVTDQLPGRHQLARLILGDDFISHEDIATAYGVSYTEDQIKHFDDTLPDIQTILWLYVNRYILIAGMPTELNRLQIRMLHIKFFKSKTEEWYAVHREKLAKREVVKAGEWLAICKEAVPNSFNKTWDQQMQLITEVEYVPNASEVIYAVTAYLKVRNIYLLRWKYVTTSSVDSNGSHVSVGSLDKNGLNVNRSWDDKCYEDMGIASARNDLFKKQ